jgi:anti-sigma regulatory factor (Ser/Thr protein kinase)
VTATVNGGVHDALFYSSDAQLLAAAVPFLRSGLDDGDAAVLICTDPTNGLLYEALDDSRAVALSHRDIYRRIAGALGVYQRTTQDLVATGVSQVRVVAETSLAESIDWDDWACHEAVANVALRELPVWVMCVYDTRQLPEPAITAGELTHPYLVNGTRRVSNPRFVQPADVMRASEPTPDPLEATPPTLEVTEPIGLRQLRDDLMDAALASGRNEDTAGCLVAAANEILGNAMIHGRSTIRLRLWATPSRLLCIVSDGGAGPADPFAGYLPPATSAFAGNGGRGLWLARQLCNRVSFAATPDGFTVRLTIH